MLCMWLFYLWGGGRNGRVEQEVEAGVGEGGAENRIGCIILEGWKELS